MKYEVLIAITSTTYTKMILDVEDYQTAETCAKENLLPRAGTHTVENIASTLETEWRCTTSQPRLVRIVQEGKKVEIKNESIAGID